MIMNNRDILALLDERIAEISRAVFDEAFSDAAISAPLHDDSIAKLRAQLALIKAKEHITVREAALLMSCSDSHIRKLVMLARKRKTARPIPFVELEGMTVFPLAELLNWAKPQTRLQVIKNEAA
jgi:hypothetical protein